MVALVVSLVVAALVGGAILYAKYGKKAEAEAVKLSDYAKADYKKAEGEVKKEVGKVEGAAKAAESDVKKVL